MIDHYNAFISYRHSERDIRVAHTIQSDLEHFHIPAKIRRSTGKKKIDRIFLDKDELGAASNLSADISAALEQAEHLIVICSNATKESQWVPREIAYFLRNHTRRQITTVLVDGEPEEVIPEILKYEDRVYRNPDGSEYTVRVPLEPLSCDYRLPRRKAKKEELPRLASKLLGCSYDELMNRRRTYMIRRLSIIFSLFLAAAIGFGAYLMYSRTQIRDNYRNSLRNQSVYLANESLYSLQQEQRILALQLALESMPKDEDDMRPVTPQAIRALTDSTLSYTTRDGLGIEDIWSYRMPDYIKKNDWELSSSGKALLAADKAGNVRVWDTSTHAILFDQAVGKRLKKATLLPDDKLLVVTTGEITLYRLGDGAVFWKEESKSPFCEAKPSVLSDDTILIATSDLKLHRLSLTDGSELAVYELPAEVDGFAMSVSEIRISPDEKKIAVKSVYDFTSQLMVIYDIPSGKAVSRSSTEYTSSFFWGDDTHLLIASIEKLLDSSYSIGYVPNVKTDRVDLRCYDPSSFTEIWNYDFTSTNVAVQSGFYPLPKNGAIAYFHANKADILQLTDGAQIASHNTNDPIILIQDPDGDGWPFYVTEKGILAFPSTTDSVSLYPYFTSNLQDAFYRSDIGFFVHSSNDYEILHYGLYVSDTSFTPLQPEKELSRFEKSWLDDKVLALITSEPADLFPGTAPEGETTVPVLSIANPSTGEQLHQIPLTDEKPIHSFRIQFIGTEGTHFYLGYPRSGNGYRVLEVDLDSGAVSEIDLAEGENVSQEFCTLDKGKLYYCCKGNADRLQLCTYDLLTKQITTYPVGDGTDYFSIRREPVILPVLHEVLLIGSEKSILVNTDNGSSRYLTLPDNWDTMWTAYNPAQNSFAFSDGNDIRLIRPDGGDDIVINCPVKPSGFSFYSDGKKGDPTLLLVAYSSGHLYRYNAETGELLGQSDLTWSSSIEPKAEFLNDPQNGLLYLQLSDTLDIIETDTWYEETSISRCLGYHSPTDRFYVYSHPNGSTYTVGYFNRYSVDELVQKAKDMLHDNEMPDSVKTEYGIEITKDE
ncbi:MAG: TIR domain-containing protein [Eubacterium sp.]|nr:TIR domain-containing protein [Eubacterium sp.]